MLQIFIIVVGKLFIFLVQQFPPTKAIKNKFFHELFNCDQCLGFYVFFVLCAFFRFTVFPDIEYIPMVHEIISAGILTFTVHVFSLGWKLKFGEFDNG